ncbi:MAG: alpha/beta hydrolase fold domain-containing protein [Chitinophagales bacterium]|nr:alpha/beta hydrolase fold domain-containing protein [Chitinophagales bacterium]
MRVPVAILFVLAVLFGNAQSTAGITGIRDTSYNLNNELKKNQKNYPFIQLPATPKTGIVSEKKGIVYCQRGNRKLLLDVFSPAQKAKDKRAAILIIHGGGWRSGDRSLHYALAQRLAALGYVCITPEYRLSSEALYPAAIHDIKAAIRWVRKNADKYQVDTNMIVVSGHSAGGELAAFMGATNGIKAFDGDGCNNTTSGKVNAVIDIDGTLAFIHPESGEGDDSKRVSAATHWLGYSKTENPAIWEEAAPLTHVGPHTPPTLFINSSVARMHAGREDFIRVLNQYGIPSSVKTFEGSPHSFILFNPWFDSTVTIINDFLKSTFVKKNKDATTQITVAKDGSGDFSSVQAALNAVPLNNKKSFTILIKNGVYKEKLRLDSSKNFVTLIGEDKFNTILTYDDHTGKLSVRGDTINTRTSWSFLLKADNFTASNITFQNNAGFTAGQAVAMEADGDKIIFRNCRFIGNQDVLFTNSDKSRQYYEHCYIEGTTDFIFGSATVWFEQCHIHSKKNSHITAASTPADKQFGYIFNDCVLTGDTSLHSVSLGRPWRPYASVLYMRCFIGEHIRPEGWSNWNNTENYKTTRYAEYRNYGASAEPYKRVNWARQLTDEEARHITPVNILGKWVPH